MKVFSLTKLGKRVARDKIGTDEEFKCLQYLKENRTATSDELDLVAGGYVVNRLIRQGLVKELTSE